MSLRPSLRRNLFKIITFSLLWSAGGAIFVLLEKGVIGDLQVYPSTGVAYEFTNNMVSVPVVSFIGGVFLISFDILFINRLVKHKSFHAILLIKSLVFLLIILATTVLSGMFATAATLDLPLFHPDVLRGVWVFLNSFASWSIILYAGFLTVLYLFIIEVSNTVGTATFLNFFTGRYHSPKVEKRVFMFLDLKGSTTIAEQLGHTAYYEFLNRYFQDISRPIQHSWGNIYQYVGDEILVHWPWHRAGESIRCFFLISEAIRKRRENYLKDFGIVPEFRAGIHGGQVSIGEIGSMKKDILYIGDVLNATSRIQGLCKEHGTDLLVSEEVLDAVPDKMLVNLEKQDIGYCDLRGKNNRLHLYHLSLS